MSCFTDKFRKLERLDALIRRRGTGSPAEMVRRLKVSALTLHNYVNDLRCLGAEIAFCSHLCTYYYVQPFRPFDRAGENLSPPKNPEDEYFFFGHCKNVALGGINIVNRGLDIYSR